MNKNSRKLSTKELTLYGLFIALVYVATRFINIPGPTPGGLFHLGNVMFFTIAIVFGKKAGAVSGGIGMALFDITSSYFVWAPFTLIIRFAMGYVIGAMASRAIEGNIDIKGDNKKGKLSAFIIKIKPLVNNTIGILIASIIMIVGYYIAGIILFGNIYAPLQSVYVNVMQCVIGAIIALPLSTSVSAAFKSKKIVVNM